MTQSKLVPQVAILSTSLKTANDLGKVFKKLNIVPDCFQSTEDFLIAQIQAKFDFVIFDINSCIYEGAPIVFRKEMNATQFAFYYDEVSVSKIAPTYSIDHLGYVNASGDLSGQVKNILVRFNSTQKLLNEVEYYQAFKHDFAPKQEALLKSNESMKEKLFYRDEIFSILKDVSSNMKARLDFAEMIANVFDGRDYVKGYSHLELQEGGARLVATEINGRKRLNIPAIWLGKKNTAIDEHAIELTQNITATLTKNPIITLTLSNDNQTIDSLLLLEIDDSTLFSFDWEIVESTISGAYAQSVRLEQKSVQNNDIKSTFELLEKLKDRSSNSHLLAFDLSDIFDFKELRKDVEFNWSLFWKDLRLNLATIISDGEIYTTSLEKVILVVDDFIFEEAFAAAKEFCQRLSLKKYFAGLELFEIQAVKIDVAEIPFSEYALVRNLEGDKAHKREAYL
ncbi:hypothetical protein [Bacteriovorax sp. Seq25_V]|uniref:hypothetical protein n=1 Tax=Bacteriovorax sp. Seq25_V TaxID=1201288 RepID=UPI00038A1739|nr:hypothetical protein [Bacteriovorax sp. Seq25_V]EQC45561.1 hypothetical protein M900_2163 [Bacteriovorax sp. Seq25_V]